MDLPFCVKTQRLILTPCTLSRLLEKSEGESDPHLKKAYQEMAEAIRNRPEEWIWRTDWDIIRSEDGLVIGGVGFKNAPDASGKVEIGYGLDPAFRGNGYMREAVIAICEWAFTNHKIRSVLAEVEDGNTPSLRVLQRAGFRPFIEGNNAWFVKERLTRTQNQEGRKSF